MSTGMWKKISKTTNIWPILKLILHSGEHFSCTLELSKTKWFEHIPAFLKWNILHMMCISKLNYEIWKIAQQDFWGQQIF